MKTIVFLAVLVSVGALSIPNEDIEDQEEVSHPNNLITVEALSISIEDSEDQEVASPNDNLFSIGALSMPNEDVEDQEAVSPRNNLILGSIGNGNRLLHRNNYVRRASPNTVQWQEITVRGASNVRITSIRAVEIGRTQYASATLKAGGINRNTATIRLQTARGMGYEYQVEVWGRLV